MSAGPAGPVRVGVIGCADIAVRRVLPAMDGEPSVVLAAVASRDPARAAELAAAYRCAVARDYDDLLAAPQVEAVYVPLPIALHATWVERALLAGKHVLGEKPLTPDAATTRRLLALADRLGLVLAENFMFPHHRRHHRVRELVAEGAIGRVHSVTAEFAVPPPPPGSIRYRPELGGGALLDIGVNPLLAAWLLLGPRLQVRGAVLRRPPDRSVDTGGAVLLSTPAGASAQVVFGMEHHYRSAYELWGEAGRLRVEGAYAPRADRPTSIVLERAGGVEEITLPPDDPYRSALRAFAAAVRRRGTPEGAASRDRTLAVSRLLGEVRAACERPSSAVGEAGARPSTGRPDP